MHTVRVLAILIPLAAARALHAQSTLHTIHGPPTSSLGTAVCGTGDLDGDGFDDFAVGLPRSALGAASSIGRVRVYSGAWVAQGLGPELLHEWTGSTAAITPSFGSALASGGDVDGDGVFDVVVGAPRDDVPGGPGFDNGSVRVLSGASGAELATFYGAGHEGLGRCVALVGDVNQDGYDDVGAGGIGYYVQPSNYHGRARVYSGEWITRTALGLVPQTPMLLHVFQGTGTDDLFGESVCGIGDVDNDGADDIAVGAHQHGAHNGGYVRVFSGASGTALLTLDGAHAYDYFGSALAAAGDVDGDGSIDLMVGAWAFDNGFAGINTNFGQVSVISGEWLSSTALGLTPLTPQLLLSLDGANPGDGFGWSLAGVGDVDFDGHADFAIGATQLGSGPPSGPGYVTLFAGRTGQTIFTRAGDAHGDGFGSATAAGRDVDGDGTPELLVGGPFSAASAGMARVFTGFDHVGTPYCSATPNSSGLAAAIDAHGKTSIAANQLVLTATDLPPQVTGLFYCGTAAVQVPLGIGLRCVGGTPLFRLPLASASSGGTCVQALDLDPLAPHATAWAAGTTWYFQCWYQDPAGGSPGFNLSNGLALVFQP